MAEALACEMCVERLMKIRESPTWPLMTPQTYLSWARRLLFQGWDWQRQYDLVYLASIESSVGVCHDAK